MPGRLFAALRPVRRQNPPSMRTFSNYLEIIFTIAGLAVIFLVSALFHPGGYDTWQVAAITATAVGVVHGLLFWFIRRRQRELRRAAITEIQGMLQEVITNQLAVIRAMAELKHERPAEAQRAATYIGQAVTAISDSLRHIDEESLKTWELKRPRLDA